MPDYCLKFIKPRPLAENQLVCTPSVSQIWSSSNQKWLDGTVEESVESFLFFVRGGLAFGFGILSLDLGFGFELGLIEVNDVT